MNAAATAVLVQQIFPHAPSNGGGGIVPGIYPSVDRAITYGSGALDYLSFGGTDFDINLRKYSTWRKGSDHNASADADIILYMQDHGSYAKSANITIKADIANFNLTNPNVFVGLNNRVFVTYSKARIANGYELTSPSDIYYKYSDDIATVALADIATATWSSELRLTTDYGELITTSTTSINLSTTAISSTLNLTIGTGLSGVVLGRIMNIASRADYNNFVRGSVTSYNPGTGATIITVTAKSGAVTRTDWDVALSSYIDGPGKAIHLGGGVLWKPVWVTLGGASSVLIYATTDNGLNWTFHSTITTDSLNPCDETCIAELPNGNIMAFIRCNSLKLLRISTYTSSWSALTTTDVPCQGKPPAVSSPSGQVFGITRNNSDVNSRTIYFWNTTPNIFTEWDWDYIDARTGNYMYGETLWDSIDLRYDSDWAMEAENTNFGEGPTIIINKKIALSTVPVAPPTTYDPDYQSVLDFSTADGDTLPSDVNKVVDSAFVARLRTEAKLIPADGYYVVKHKNAALSAFSLRNWRKAWIKATSTGTYGVTGWDFNGTSQFFESNIQLNLQAKYLQNDAEIVFYTEEEGTTTGVEMGCGEGSFATRQNAVMLELRFTSNTAFFGINGPLTLSSIANTTAVGLWELKRTSSTTIELWKNGVLFASASTTSTGRASVSPIVGGEKFGNGNFLFNPRSFGLLAVCGVKGTWQDAWQARIAALT